MKKIKNTDIKSFEEHFPVGSEVTIKKSSKSSGGVRVTYIKRAKIVKFIKRNSWDKVKVELKIVEGYANYTHHSYNYRYFTPMGEGPLYVFADCLELGSIAIGDNYEIF